MLIFLLAHIAMYINELQRKNKKNTINKLIFQETIVPNKNIF